MSVNTRLAAQAVTSATPSRATTSATTSLDAASGGTRELGFEDLIDAVNPLQQLPVISSVYREATGDSISIPARLVGGLLYGGPVGMLGSAAMVVFEGITGGSLIDDVAGLFGGGESDTVAANTRTGTGGPTAQPWLKTDATSGDATTLPSVPVLAEALRRQTDGGDDETAPALTTSPSTAQAATDSTTLAKLYALKATANAGRPGDGKGAV